MSIVETARSTLQSPREFQQLLLDHTIEAAAIAVLILLFTVGVIVYYRYYHQTPAKKFKRILSEYDAISVLMHPNPDPDSMASAIATKAIAEHYGTDVTIWYAGQIKHQENRAFRTVLDLDFNKLESSEDIPEEDPVVLVDHNTPRGFTESETIEPTVVIDHHPGNGTGTEFTDIRTEYGSTATILGQYLNDLGAKFQNPELSASEFQITKEVATGLLYGIYSDTNNLSNGCIQADFNVASWLFQGIDESLLERVSNPQVSFEVLQVKAEAIENIETTGSFGVSNIGITENADSISQAADELMHLEGVTAVVVYGRYNGTIHISGRSRDDRVHMGDCINNAIGDIPMANGGGHARMGGGQIPIGPVDGLGSDNGVQIEELEERLFKAMTGDW